MTDRLEQLASLARAIDKSVAEHGVWVCRQFMQYPFGWAAVITQTAHPQTFQYLDAPLCTFIFEELNKPIFRDLAFRAFYAHINLNISYEEDCPLICASLLDSWSRIRKASAKSLASMAPDSLMAVAEALLGICSGGIESLSWQALDGLCLGFATILQQFHIQFADSGEIMTISFGSSTHYISSLPVFVHKVHTELIAPLLYDARLEVRNSALRCFAAYSLLIPPTSALTLLVQMTQRLLHGCIPFHDITPCQLTHWDIALHSSHMTIDTSHAEGYLSCCMCLIKRLCSHPLLLLRIWPLGIPVYAAYLSHPASTVRLGASLIVKTFLEKSQASVWLLRAVLQCLGSDWEVLKSTRLHALQLTSTSHSPTFSPSTSLDPSLEHHSWQWREGRLLAYDLIFRYILSNFSKRSLLAETAPQSPKPSQLSKKWTSLASISHRRNSLPLEPVQSNISKPLPSLFFVPVHPTYSSLMDDLHIAKDESTPTSPSSPLAWSSQSLDQVWSPRQSNLKSALWQYIDQNASTSLEFPYNDDFTFPNVDAEALMGQILHGDNVFWHVSSLIPPDIIFRHCLVQIIEGIASDSWELRRMANQCFEPLIEILLWFDHRLLESFWQLFLRSTDTLPCALATRMLLIVMKKCLMFRRLLRSTQRVPSTKKVLRRSLGHSRDSPPRMGNYRSRVIQLTDQLIVIVQHLLPMLHTMLSQANTVPCKQFGLNAILHAIVLLRLNLPSKLQSSLMEACYKSTVVNRTSLAPPVVTNKRFSVQLTIDALELATYSSTHTSFAPWIQSSLSHDFFAMLPHLVLTMSWRQMLDWTLFICHCSDLTDDLRILSSLLEALIRTFLLPFAWLNASSQHANTTQDNRFICLHTPFDLPSTCFGQSHSDPQQSPILPQSPDYRTPRGSVPSSSHRIAHRRSLSLPAGFVFQNVDEAKRYQRMYTYLRPPIDMNASSICDEILNLPEFERACQASAVQVLHMIRSLDTDMMILKKAFELGFIILHLRPDLLSPTLIAKASVQRIEVQVGNVLEMTRPMTAPSPTPSEEDPWGDWSDAEDESDGSEIEEATQKPGMGDTELMYGLCQCLHQLAKTMPETRTFHQTHLHSLHENPSIRIPTSPGHNSLTVPQYGTPHRKHTTSTLEILEQLFDDDAPCTPHERMVLQWLLESYHDDSL